MNEIIQRTHIKVNETVSSWEEAIYRAGDVLVKAGSITKDYIDKMISVVKEYGPYIVISPRLALAHAAPGEYVLRNDISLITLSSPVNFGSDNDPVSVILCMGCTDHSSHLNRLSKIAEVLSNERLIDDLIEAKTVEDIMLILNN